MSIRIEEGKRKRGKGTFASSLLDLDEWMVDLVETNVGKFYKNSSIGWDRVSKRKELCLSSMEYLVAIPNDSQTFSPVAFVAFMETNELDNNGNERMMIYCYELQVETAWQNNGIGLQLLGRLEAIANERVKSKNAPTVILTSFKQNKAANRFYMRNGFKCDETCPSKHGMMDCDYLIFSK